MKINKINKSISVIMIDVDDTLLLWDSPKLKTKDKISMNYADQVVYLTPHKRHIDLVKHWYDEGYSLYVWSGHGSKWATQAIKKLKLTSYIHHIMSKPIKYVDDLQAEDILGNRVFIPHKENPK